MDEVREIARAFGMEDLNLIKPGIGETTRVLLRRAPWKVLIHEKYQGDRSLCHIVRLAQEKHVPIEYYPLYHYGLRHHQKIIRYIENGSASVYRRQDLSKPIPLVILSPAYRC